MSVVVPAMLGPVGRQGGSAGMERDADAVLPRAGAADQVAVVEPNPPCPGSHSKRRAAERLPAAPSAGGVPPLVVAVKVTGTLTTGVLGEIVKLVDNVGGVTEPKNSVIGAAFASFDVSELRPQTVSRVLRYE